VETVLGLRRLQSEGRHEDALAAARAMLVDWPRNRGLLLVEASSLRHLLRIDEAMESLARLEILQPKFSLLHQERGLCYVARRDAPPAIDALLRAVNINPALPLAWKMLEGLYRLTGDAANRATAAAHAATLAALPGEVVACAALFADGDLAPAEQRIRAFLLRHGDHQEAMRLLAKIGARGVLDDAELLLAAMLESDHRAARLEYARCLVDRHRYAAAQEQLERLLALDPVNLDYRALAAAAAVGLGRDGRCLPPRGRPARPGRAGCPGRGRDSGIPISESADTDYSARSRHAIDRAAATRAAEGRKSSTPTLDVRGEPAERRCHISELFPS